MSTAPSRVFIPDGMNHTSDPVITTHALLFHCRKSVLAAVTAHEVSAAARGKGAALKPGRPLTPEDEAAILSLLQSQRVTTKLTILPGNVLFADADLSVWHEPSVVRPMHFMREGRQHTILTRWPSLVMAVRGRTLHVVALDTDDRPAAETPIYHAPLANVYGNTSVCTGSAQRPPNAEIAMIPSWNAVIYDTCFTHDNHTNVLRLPLKRAKRKSASATGPDGNDKAMRFWLARESNIAPFPNETLNPLGMSLAEWVDAIRQARSHV